MSTIASYLIIDVLLQYNAPSHNGGNHMNSLADILEYSYILLIEGLFNCIVWSVFICLGHLFPFINGRLQQAVT